MEYLSDTVKSLQPPATIKISEAARELRTKGFDVISLSIGEPDFNTPDFIKKAAKQAIDENFSKYTPVSGFVDLREAISRKFKRENNIDYDVSEIVVSTGAKQSIINAFLCLLNKGDIILLETKGDHLVNQDSRSKNILGKTWEKLAGETFKYFMVFQSAKVENTYTAYSMIEVLKGL